jgi:hypothetical protein
VFLVVLAAQWLVTGNRCILTDLENRLEFQLCGYVRTPSVVDGCGVALRGQLVLMTALALVAVTSYLGYWEPLEAARWGVQAAQEMVGAGCRRVAAEPDVL